MLYSEAKGQDWKPFLESLFLGKKFHSHNASLYGCTPCDGLAAHSEVSKKKVGIAPLVVWRAWPKTDSSFYLMTRIVHHSYSLPRKDAWKSSVFFCIVRLDGWGRLLADRAQVQKPNHEVPGNITSPHQVVIHYCLFSSWFNN